ncbi:hypothetical protein C1I98_32030 [Spongiactinospora gelatinilytica]|uniref:DUF397 domain-containing protein n=1 Tax=Spongiactinospora gelatinilytica TaxID=2666298 RepID=A0A2W2EXT0_9ACTN|nr:DUF397 domain-containing protein [Spongiactinospora gelatinilytica]PZG29426.1 hypothetical protein C1I98_32030 [Spongiactinospora gelatinilytica]
MDLSVAEWRKSSHSADNGGQRVEVARNLHGVVAVRDGEHPGGPIPVFTPGEWHFFLAGVKGAPSARALPRRSMANGARPVRRWGAAAPGVPVRRMGPLG